MKSIVSLFDESGNMLRPWAEEGYECFAFDLQNVGKAVERFENGGRIHFIAEDLFEKSVQDKIVALKPSVIFGFPPCTDLSVSGAKHFGKKAYGNPSFQAEAVKLCKVVETLGKLCDCPWMLENPVSMLSTLWKEPAFRFHPWEYGGYLPDDDVHPRWPEYIAARDAYPKLTCIWAGNGFYQPMRKPVQVEGGFSRQFKKLGGKSVKTKQIRSETPRGFAKAVFLGLEDWLK